MLKANASESEKRDLLQELAIMKLLEPHPNVVRLLGCCTEKGISHFLEQFLSNILKCHIIYSVLVLYYELFLSRSHLCDY